ncbi:hypothetical protein TrVE_jg1759 [Triparma verrucosa]|uniref:DNL-type domain-containing protein n=1 Tax=Triparma verrucosa TaxID=1606542 RepID=A0A9W7CMW4_9STRA|nr:hypothetical protein TrVE_jg1759 [Triparma verrucosa]
MYAAMGLPDEDESSDVIDPSLKLFPLPKPSPTTPPSPLVPSQIPTFSHPPTINVTSPSKSVPIAFVASPQVQIQYTCNLCSHTSRHTLTRLAYTSGCVICQCKGCGVKHLIADHLGWYDFLPDGGTIEDFMNNNGGKATRVSEHVWEMESLVLDSPPEN